MYYECIDSPVDREHFGVVLPRSEGPECIPTGGLGSRSSKPRAEMSGEERRKEYMKRKAGGGGGGRWRPDLGAAL